MKKTLLILPLVLLASALALSACGGGSSSSGGGEEGAIKEAIEEGATSTDASKCTEFQTVAFNEQQTGAKGAKATEVCEEEVESGASSPESVTIDNVQENGETATAEVGVEGSGLGGQTIELELIKEEENWKLNEFTGFAKFDASALASSLEESLEEEGSVEPKQVKCLGEGLAGLSQQEAEELTFEHNLEPVEKLYEGCE